MVRTLLRDGQDQWDRVHYAGEKPSGSMSLRVQNSQCLAEWIWLFLRWFVWQDNVLQPFIRRSVYMCAYAPSPPCEQ